MIEISSNSDTETLSKSRLEAVNEILRNYRHKYFDDHYFSWTEAILLLYYYYMTNKSECMKIYSKLFERTENIELFYQAIKHWNEFKKPVSYIKDLEQIPAAYKLLYIPTREEVFEMIKFLGVK